MADRRPTHFAPGLDKIATKPLDDREKLQTQLDARKRELWRQAAFSAMLRGQAKLKSERRLACAEAQKAKQQAAA
jgi:hypothetical protein